MSSPGKGMETPGTQVIFIIIICALVPEKWLVMKSSWCAIFFDGRLGIGRNSLWTSLNDLLNSTFGPLASRHLECNLNGVLNVCVTNVMTNFCYVFL